MSTPVSNSYRVDLECPPGGVRSDQTRVLVPVPKADFLDPAVFQGIRFSELLRKLQGNTMRRTWFVPAIFALGPGTLWLTADTVVLRSGKSVQGTFVGGSARQVEFLPVSGETMRIPVGEVVSVNFSSLPVSSVDREASRATKRAAVVIPAGTAFRVRTVDPIDVDSTQAGVKFRGSMDDPIMLGGDVVVPRGADVVMVAAKVAQGGRMKGSDLIQLKVNSISLRGRSYPVVTSISETKSGGEGKKTARKVIGGTGLGAIIGGIAGGGTGAAIGALAGGATGTAIAASGQPHLKIPSETRLQFQLVADWKIR